MKYLVILIALLFVQGCASTIAKSNCKSLGYEGESQNRCAERMLNNYYGANHIIIKNRRESND